MGTPRFRRTILPGMTGVDVEGVGRALCHANVFLSIRVFEALPAPIRRRYGSRKIAAVRKFQRKSGIVADGIYGPRTHMQLTPYFDALAIKLNNSYQPRTWQDKKFDLLLAAMKEFSDHTPGYRWGAGHGERLSQISPSQYLDCSSSTSAVLYRAGLFDHDYAWVSGDFAWSYGERGEGKYFTVYASSVHVWIRLHRSRWWRFDTSPHGDGGLGPRLRYLPRFTNTFTARHFPGM